MRAEGVGIHTPGGEELGKHSHLITKTGTRKRKSRVPGAGGRERVGGNQNIHHPNVMRPVAYSSLINTPIGFLVTQRRITATLRTSFLPTMLYHRITACFCCRWCWWADHADCHRCLGSDSVSLAAASAATMHRTRASLAAVSAAAQRGPNQR